MATAAPGKTVARVSGNTRKGASITLIVLHSDPRPAAQALAAYRTSRDKITTHYYIDQSGTVASIVPEERAARHSGSAFWNKRRRNIDRISISITLEHVPGTWVPRSQYGALYLLAEQLRQRYDLPVDAIVRWDAPLGPHARDGALIPLVLPPEPAPAPNERDAGKHAEGLEEEAGPMVLGGIAPQELWTALVQDTFRVRGEGFHSNWAFHLAADTQGLGAPLARSAPSAQYVTCEGKQYGFQVFAGDTLFNEVPQWSTVQCLSAILGDSIPPSGFARQLLEASYRATGTALFDTYAFHQLAVRERLGPPLGANYRATLDGQPYAMQVFAGDTLYTPIASPEAATNWSDVRRLSQTPPGALADALWTETYKPSGAAYTPSSPFHQAALQAGLGAPLNDVYQMAPSGVTYDVQIFARDTLYAEAGGAPQRMSALTHDASAVPAPMPSTPPVTSSNGGNAAIGVSAGILGPSGIDSAWLAQNPNAPSKVRQLLAQATCLLGYENTIFDSLPDQLRGLTWGADARNQSSNGLNYKDICCADLVTLILAASNLNWRWTGPNGANHRMAHYYTPYSGNALMREVGGGEAYMPGDIIVVSYDGGPQADHVLMYVGALGGKLTANGKQYDPKTYNLVEASINYAGGKTEIYKYNLPSQALDWYRRNTKWMRRGRLLELEQAYREAGML